MCFRSNPRKKKTTPMLQIIIKNKSNMVCNIFSTFHMAYIREQVDTINKNQIQGVLNFSNFSLLEGNKSNYQWLACSVIVSISCLVIAPPNELFIGLGFSSLKIEPDDIATFGASLTIDNAPFSDTARVSWCVYDSNKHHQFTSTESSIRSNAYVGSTDPSIITSILNFKTESSQKSQTTNISCISTVSLKGISLVGAGNPELVDLSHPFYGQLLIKSVGIIFELPTILSIADSKIQISRKNGYTNLVIPFIKSNSKSKSCHRIFRMFRESLSQSGFTIFGIPRMTLDSLPKINCDKIRTEKHGWLRTLAGSQLLINERLSSTDKTAVNFLKETIHDMTLNFIGSNEEGLSYKLFGFESPTMGVEMIVFINCIRLDDCQHSVVLDVAVCIFEIEMPDVNNIENWFYLQDGSRLTKVEDAEIEIWKTIFPVLSECTRNNWTHEKQCEYHVLSKSRNDDNESVPILDNIPRSISQGKATVCSCCLGKELNNTEFKEYLSLDKSALKNIYPNFFRAAIPLVFSP